MIAAIIDKGIPGGEAGYIVKMGLILVGLGLVGLASSVTAQYFAAKAAVGAATRLRHALFAQIQRFSYNDLDRIGASTLITRMTSDINQVQIRHQSRPAPVPALAVYRVRCNDHGLHLSTVAAR